MQSVHELILYYIFCFRSNNVKYLTREFETFLSHLASALKVKVLEPINFSQKITELIDHIKNEIQEETEDIMDFTTLLNLCYNEFQNLQSQTDVKIHNSIANVYMLLSYLKILLNVNVPHIDPMVKITLLRKYCTEDIQDSYVLRYNYEIQNQVYCDSKKSLHPYAKLLEKKIKDLTQETEEYEKYVSVRPKDTSYELITKVVYCVFRSLLIQLNFYDFIGCFSCICYSFFCEENVGTISKLK